MSKPSFRETGLAIGYYINKPTEKMNCIECGLLFSTKQPKRARFCSRRCDSNFRRKQTRDFIRKFKMEKGCIDCGYREHPAALDFDHILEKGNKRRQISQAPTMKHFMEESVKCEIRCANCHRIKTFERHIGKVGHFRGVYKMQGGSQ